VVVVVVVVVVEVEVEVEVVELYDRGLQKANVC